MKKTYLEKGFTLIELLVVIAIIGILSSVVLASLGSARNKGKAASVKASIASMKTEAELGADNSGTYNDDICTAVATGSFGTLTAAVTAGGGTAVSCGQNTADNTRPASWGYAATLPDGTHFCVDSTGFSGPSTVVPGTEIANGYSSADVVCSNS